jgi:hypothetical protein
MRLHSASAFVLATVLLLGGCAAQPASTRTAESTPVVAATDVPGSTLDASAVTADAPHGLTLAVVTAAAGPQETLVREAVEAFAEAHDGSVSVHVDASTPDAVTAALTEDVDVVVGIGPAVAGAIDRASASHLETSFLVLGTQLAEPTGNVVAVVWPGADERAVFADQELGFEGADVYAADAVEVGLAAFTSGLDGHVIALE